MKEAFDLIRKQDVLDIIHRYSCNTARIEEGVLNLPIVEAEYGNRWIPVEKAIPEDGQPIIATFTDGSVYQVNFKLFLHENPEYAHNHNVIAWMPLPSPYKPTTD